MCELQQCMQALVDPETNATPEGVVLQQFEEHGGVLFKVYVLGSTCEVKLRPSLQLPREAQDAKACRSGWMVLPRFSTTPIAEDVSKPYAAPPVRGDDGDEGELGGMHGHQNSGGEDTPGSSPAACVLLLSLCAVAMYVCF
jgi:hypothetical protein